MYKLLVDLRGKEIKEIKPLLPLMNTPYEVKRTFSDFVLFEDDNPILVVERKTMTDLVSSLGKRLNSQLIRMKPYTPASFVILVGKLADIKYVAKMKKMKFSEEHLFGAIASSSIRAGVHFLWVQDNTQAIVLIDKICEKFIEGKLDVPIVTKKDKEKLRAITLSFCWGVTPELGKKLLKKFGSIENIINASEEDFKEMGISKRIWTDIQGFYRG